MRKLFIITLCVCILSSCYKKNDLFPDANGFLSIQVHASMSIEEDNGRLSEVNTDNFEITIYTNNHVEVISYLAIDLPPIIELPVGEYYVTAHSNNLIPAGFENPYYYGKTALFQIKFEENKQVPVTCTLSNCKLTIDYSSNIKNNFSAYSSIVNYSGGSLSFSQAEDRTAYFDLIPLTIVSTLQYMSGGIPVEKTITGEISNPEPKKHYKIVIDATLNNGGADFNIIVDEIVDVVDLTFGESSGEPPVPTIDMSSVQYGHLIISEIMFDPNAQADNVGEWIEIFNASTNNININGLKLIDNTTTIIINQDYVLQPSSYMTVAKTVTAIENPTIVASINLSNTGELLKLSSPSDVEICSLDYAQIIQAVTISAGSSIALSRNKYNVDEAKLPVNWCSATVVYSTGDKGTPGNDNDVCQ